MASLDGKIILSTRSAVEFDELSCLLTGHGARVIWVPCIETVAIENSPLVATSVTWLAGFTHLVFTSQHGVRFFFDLIDHAGIAIPPGMSIVALGAKTAEAIEKRGYAAETFGGFQTSMALARHLKEHVLTPEHSVLLALGRMADTSVQDILEGTCRVARVNVYDTTRPAGLDTTLDVLAQTPFDAVVFSSPSAIQSVVQHQHFASLLGQKYLFCVGKTTGRALATAGLSPSLTSSSPQPGVFAREIVQFFSLQSSSLLP